MNVGSRRNVLQIPRSAQTVIVSDAQELQDVISKLVPGQTVEIDRTKPIIVRSTLSIAEENITIRAKDGTNAIIRCSPTLSTGAIRIQNVNISMESVRLEGCNRAPAVEIFNNRGGPQSHVTSIMVNFTNVEFHLNGHEGARVNGSAIRINRCTGNDCKPAQILLNSCAFSDNRGAFGGAVHAKGADVSIDHCSFYRNEATCSGGAVYYATTAAHQKLIVADTVFERNALVRDRSEMNRHQNHLSDPVLGKGGALLIFNPKEAIIQQTTFRNSLAYSAGGALMIQNTAALCSATVIKSLFEANIVEDERKELLPGFWIIDPTFFGGGALSCISNGTALANIVVDSTVFINNSAHFGGGLHVAGFVDTLITVRSATFERNNATGGGAISVTGAQAKISMRDSRVCHCLAIWGGGIHVVFGARLIVDSDPFNISTRSIIEYNKATLGGGINGGGCSEIALRLMTVKNNVAFLYGGGIHTLGVADRIHLSAMKISQNIAAIGGGFASFASPTVTVDGIGADRTQFVKNKALTGGGMYFNLGPDLPAALIVEDTDFRRNEARDKMFKDLFGLHSFVKAFQPTSFISPLHHKALAGAIADTIGVMDTFVSVQRGQGGGFATNLAGILLLTFVNIAFKNVTFRDNAAKVGGATSVHFSELLWNRGPYKTCVPTSLHVDPCQRFYFIDVSIQRNQAQYGGGIFVTHPEFILISCREEDVDTSISLESVLTLQQSSGRRLDPLSDLRCLDVTNNTQMDGSKRQSDVGTLAKRLALDQLIENASLKTVASGELLAVSCQGLKDQSCSEELAILVQDSFNQTIRGGIDDANLQITLQSSHITGDTRYTASRGRAVIDNAKAIGIGITANVTIFSDNRPDIEVQTGFSTTKCRIGEEQRGQICANCLVDSYSFDLLHQDCQSCEENAICSGGAALVPIAGFWHSTPFSPQLHRCIFDSGCNYKNRESKLTDYYKETEKVEKEIQKLHAYLSNHTEKPEFESYQQCAPGYSGVLCGSCVNNYGHGRSGACERCPDKHSVTGTLLGLSIFWTFVMIGINCAMVLLSTRTRVQLAKYEADDEVKNRRHRIIRRAIRHIESVHNIDLRFQQNRNTASSSQISDPDARRLRAHQLVATVQLTETFKILVNYLQVTSAAARLGVEWQVTMNRLFSVQAILVGGVPEAVSVPYECLVLRYSQSGLPAVVALWLRVSVPIMVLWMLLLLYIIAWIAYHFCRKQQSNQMQSSLSAKLVTGSIVILVVAIYFSYIDNVREFVRTVNCLTIDKDLTDSRHPYQVYAIETGSAVWAEDTALTCFRGDHLATGVVGIIGLVLAVGIILFIVLLPTICPTESEDAEFVARYWFIYQAYKNERFVKTWEAAILIRKALIASILVFSFRLRTSLQASLCVGVLLVAQTLQMALQPFKVHEDHEHVPIYAGAVLRWIHAGKLATAWIDFNNKLSSNHLECASLFSSVLIFYTAVILADANSSKIGSQAIIVVAFTVSICFLTFMGYRLYCGLHLVLDSKLEIDNANFMATHENSLSPLHLLRKFLATIAIWLAKFSKTDGNSTTVTSRETGFEDAHTSQDNV